MNCVKDRQVNGLTEEWVSKGKIKIFYMYMKYMVFALFIGRFKATPPHPIWIEHLTKKVIFCDFSVCKRPSHPLFTEGTVEVC